MRIQGWNIISAASILEVFEGWLYIFSCLMCYCKDTRCISSSVSGLVRKMMSELCSSHKLSLCNECTGGSFSPRKQGESTLLVQSQYSSFPHTEKERKQNSLAFFKSILNILNTINQLVILEIREKKGVINPSLFQMIISNPQLPGIWGEHQKKKRAQRGFLCLVSKQTAFSSFQSFYWTSF